MAAEVLWEETLEYQDSRALLILSVGVSKLHLAFVQVRGQDFRNKTNRLDLTTSDCLDKRDEILAGVHDICRWYVFIFLVSHLSIEFHMAFVSLHSKIPE